MRWRCIGWLLAMVAAACLGAIAAPLPAQDWTEIRSPHFLVFTDASAKEGRSVATHFEQIRAVFRAALPGVQVDPSEPVRILAVRDGEDFRQLLPEFWEKQGEMHPSGYFVGGNGRYYVALRLDAAGKNDLIFYHEYVHLLESLNFANLPLWLSEGLADYYGSVRFFGRKVGIGYPIEVNVRLLSKAEKIPLERLLAMKWTSPDYNEAKTAGVFYAEAWALTDYLFTADGGARRPSVFRYLSLVSKGAGSVDAAREAFGNLDRLDAELFRFLREGRFHYYTVAAPFPKQEADLSSRSLSAAAADAVIGDFMAVRGKPAAARTWLNAAIRIDPTLPEPYVSLGRLALQEDQRPAALRLFDRAVALHSKSYLAWYYRAMISLRDRKDPDVSKQAEADFEECLRLNPNFAEGYRALADLLSLLKRNPGRALALARRAVALKPAEAENYLTLGVVLLRMGKTGEAAAEGRRALRLAQDAGERKDISRFLHAVHQTQEAIASGQPVVFFGPLPTWPHSVLTERQADRTSHSNPDAASEAAVSRAPANVHLAEGVARNVECKGRELTLVVASGDSEWHLHASDFTRIEYESAGTPPTSFSPCSGLEGRRITAHYVPVRDKTGSGELTRIDLER